MGLLYMEQIRGYPYMSIPKLAKEFEHHPRTIRRRIDGIEQEIKAGRYNQYAILESGGEIRVNAYVFADYEKYWKMLQDKYARKSVPEFRPDDLAEICGYNQRAVLTREAEEKTIPGLLKELIELFQEEERKQAESHKQTVLRHQEIMGLIEIARKRGTSH